MSFSSGSIVYDILTKVKLVKMLGTGTQKMILNVGFFLST